MGDFMNTPKNTSIGSMSTNDLFVCLKSSERVTKSFQTICKERNFTYDDLKLNHNLIYELYQKAIDRLIDDNTSKPFSINDLIQDIKKEVKPDNKPIPVIVDPKPSRSQENQSKSEEMKNVKNAMVKALISALEKLDESEREKRFDVLMTEPRRLMSRKILGSHYKNFVMRKSIVRDVFRHFKIDYKI